jgi:Protein of unknown function (DUF3300)
MKLEVLRRRGRALGRLARYGFVAWAGAVLCLGGSAWAQEAAEEAALPAGQLLGPDELRRVVAPVAFYSDDLLAIVLPASANALQVVEAQRFLEKRAKNQKLQPDADWDPAILALINYPEVIEKMNADIEWTTTLGNAVIDQLQDVMDMIQQLRAEAAGSGYLQTNVMQVVIWEDDYWHIYPYDPDYIYIPDYPPDHPIFNPPGTRPPGDGLVRPEHPIVYPPPPYVSHYPYWSPGAVFFAGAILGSNFGYGFDWGGGDININVGDNCCRGGRVDIGAGNRVDHRVGDRFGADRQWVNGKNKMTWSANKARQRQQATGVRPSGGRNKAGTLPAKQRGAGAAAKQKGPKLVNPATNLGGNKGLSGDKSLRGDRSSGLGSYDSNRDAYRDRNQGRDSLRDSRSSRDRSSADRTRSRTRSNGAFGGYSGGSSVRMNSSRGSRSMGGSRGSRGGRR